MYVALTTNSSTKQTTLHSVRAALLGGHRNRSSLPVSTWRFNWQQPVVAGRGGSQGVLISENNPVFSIWNQDEQHTHTHNTFRKGDNNITTPDHISTQSTTLQLLGAPNQTKGQGRLPSRPQFCVIYQWHTASSDLVSSCNSLTFTKHQLHVNPVGAG